MREPIGEVFKSKQKRMISSGPLARLNYFQTQSRIFAGADYSQPLRSIGQALEILKFEAFEMENEGENYLIRGTADRSRAYISGPAIEQSAVEHVWGPIPEEPDRMSRSVGMLSTLPVELELRYTRQDLERLEQEGRARRTDPQRTPNASSLSQLPRAAGAYLDSNRLLQIARHGESVMIRYETTSKEKVEDMLAYSSLYDF